MSTLSVPPPSSCSLAGRAYPLGDIPEDLVSQVKNKVTLLLLLNAAI